MPAPSVRWSRVLAFVVVTFALTLAWTGGARALGIGFGGVGILNPGSLIVGVGMMWIPGLVALLLTRFVDGLPVGRGLAITNRPVWRWMLVALVWPLALPVVANLVALLLPGITFDGSGLAFVERLESMLPAEMITSPEWAEGRARILALGGVTLFLLGLVQAIPAAATVNALAAIGEELGWRGYLHRELAPLGLWRASLVIGPIWGLWHAPAILQGHNYPHHPVAGVLLMTLWCTALAPLLAWVRARTRSVWGAAWFHGSINATGGLGIVFVRGGDDLLVGVTGLAGIVGTAGLAALLLLRRAPPLTDDTTSLPAGEGDSTRDSAATRPE